MERLDEEMQIIAVEKVLEEMKKAEEFVMQWNSSWCEQLLDAYCLPMHYEIGETDVRDMERKYEPRYKLSNAYYSKENIGVPLIKETLIGNNTLTGEKNINFECQFGRIDWYGMNSHKSSRHFSFHNNGDISFEKNVRRKQSIQNPKQISYEAAFNVLSNGFTIEITVNELNQNYKNRYDYDHLTFSLKNNLLVKRFNNIEIIQDLNTGLKTIKIEKKHENRNSYDNISVVFEATFNTDDSLENGSISINTHKSNGKVNGTYRFDASRKKGVRANFYSRKGSKTDLTTTPTLLENAITLLSTSCNTQNNSDIIISNFIDYIQNAIESKEETNLNNHDFNIEAVKQTELRIIEMVKCIKGELPLYGLVERIDDCLSLFNNEIQENLEKTAKILKR